MRLGDKIERPKNAGFVIGRLWGYVAAHRGALIAASLIVAASSGLDLCGPYLMSRAIDKGILQHNLHVLALICALMLVAYVLSAALNWSQNYLMAAAALRIVSDLRADLFQKMQHL